MQLGNFTQYMSMSQSLFYSDVSVSAMSTSICLSVCDIEEVLAFVAFHVTLSIFLVSIALVADVL